jgi:hypothetical protein
MSSQSYDAPTPSEGEREAAFARIRAKLDRIPDSDAVTLDKADVRAVLTPPAPVDREKLIAEAIDAANVRITADDDYSVLDDEQAEARALGFNQAQDIIEPYVEQLAALAVSPAPARDESLEPEWLSPHEVRALPVGSVVMTETDPESFGVYEQRVWQRFGGAPDWQFQHSRYEWQSTDGGFVRVSDAERGPAFAVNRRVTLLYSPGPLPVTEEERDDAG